MEWMLTQPSHNKTEQLHPKTNYNHQSDKVMVVEQFGVNHKPHDVLISDCKPLLMRAQGNRVLLAWRCVWRRCCWRWTSLTACHRLQACFVSWPAECWHDPKRTVWTLKIDNFIGFLASDIFCILCAFFFFLVNKSMFNSFTWWTVPRLLFFVTFI